MLAKAKEKAQEAVRKAEEKALAMASPLDPAMEAKVAKYVAEKDANCVFTEDDKLWMIIPPTFKSMLKRLYNAKKITMERCKLENAAFPEESKSHEYKVAYLNMSENPLSQGSSRSLPICRS